MTIYTLMPLHESLGLAIIGVDLSMPIDAETSENLLRLLADHLVLVFPDQSLSPEQYLAAAAVFGPPMRQHYSRRLSPGHPDIGLVSHRYGPDAADSWHTDHTDRERPPAATILYAVKIPSSGGTTSIANMRAAYWTLPDEERRHLETLRTVNRVDPQGNEAGADGLVKADAQVIHPMVRIHPVNRERAVYFHPTKTMHIEGMTPRASQDYLADLVARTIQPDIIYQHGWVKGDVVVIDDHATLYRAHADHDPGETRQLWQITVEGERPTLA